MLQSTMPLYLSEIAPTQIRGFYINAYSLWVLPSSLPICPLHPLFANITSMDGC